MGFAVVQKPIFYNYFSSGIFVVLFARFARFTIIAAGTITSTVTFFGFWIFH